MKAWRMLQRLAALPDSLAAYHAGVLEHVEFLAHRLAPAPEKGPLVHFLLIGKCAVRDRFGAREWGEDYYGTSVRLGKYGAELKLEPLRPLSGGTLLLLHDPETVRCEAFRLGAEIVASGVSMCAFNQHLAVGYTVSCTAVRIG